MHTLGDRYCVHSYTGGEPGVLDSSLGSVISSSWLTVRRELIRVSCDFENTS